LGKKTILFILGTRPEAIKLCPLILWLKRAPALYEVRVCVTAQHRQMLDQVLSVFGVLPDHDLDLMLPGQTLLESASRMLAGLEPVLTLEKPDLVIVQGDTTTTMCGSLAGFYQHVSVAHIEAGLRTGDLQQPFPEELNRVLTARMTALHFAATAGAAQNLLHEGVSSGRIMVTGNTGIDALLFVEQGLIRGRYDRSTLYRPPQHGRKLILVTAHRRESFGAGFERICRALAQLANREDVQIVFPVHPNPNVQVPVKRHLASHPRVSLIAPLDYVPFVDLMRQAHLLLTDSGGIQEEGPSLGKPVLVLREKTERPEAVAAGTAKLVGTNVSRIVSEAALLLDSEKEYASMTRRHNPYGDGHACPRIEATLRTFFGFGVSHDEYGQQPCLQDRGQPEA
jgi:UDP-N-acetylglucosamine 2-epimerase (non-hydrolysing)